MIAMPNMEKPKSCYNHCEFIAMEEVGCPLKDYTESHQYKDKIHPGCPLIEIAEPTETIIHDIRKLIAFIEPRMIIASTYAEQIERAEAVKNWLLSIVGERRTDPNNCKECELADKCDHHICLKAVRERRTDE